MLTSDLVLGAGVTASLTSANGIDAAGFDLSGARLTLNLTGGTITATTITAQSLTLSNTTIDAFLTAGTLNVNGGTVALTGGGGGAGNFNVAAGATLDFAGGTQTLSAPGTITGAGDVRFSGGTTTVGGAYTVSGLTTINGGIANFDGSATAASVAAFGGNVGRRGEFPCDRPVRLDRRHDGGHRLDDRGRCVHHFRGRRRDDYRRAKHHRKRRHEFQWRKL